MNGDAKAYWERVFREKREQNWHQDKPDEISVFIKESNVNSNDLVLCVGDSKLVDNLLEKDFTNIIANDISEVALQKVNTRNGENAIGKIPYG
ncbi:MAG: hypothetical protein AB8G15_03500 [Saprospiraceae bacterium]